MKRYSLILFLVLTVSLCGVASAQILMPADFATVGTRATYYINMYNYKNYGPYGNYPGSWTTVLGVGKYPGIVNYSIPWITLYVYDGQGAIEFDLAPVLSPTFTSKSFTAKLNGLNVDSAYQTLTTGPMDVDLFDMADTAEDGNAFETDFNSTRGSRIARLSHDFAGTNADFTDIDVTCALRNDLFGSGAGNYSGFILKSPNAELFEFIAYDYTTPEIVITPGVPGPKCGGGGGGGGGCFIVNAAR